jgi:hypothetical protein
MSGAGIVADPADESIELVRSFHGKLDQFLSRTDSLGEALVDTNRRLAEMAANWERMLRRWGRIEQRDREKAQVIESQKKS